MGFCKCESEKSDVFLVSAGCSGQSKYTVASRFEPPRHRSAEFSLFLREMYANPTESSIQKYLNSRKRRNDYGRRESTSQEYKIPSAAGGRRSSSKEFSIKNYQSLNYTNLLICGYEIKLPPNIQPYATQRTMIAKILTTLKNKLNALIESPTGSGKTLGLLSASCAWLERYKKERTQSRNECRACRNGGSSEHTLNKSSEQNMSGKLNDTLNDNNNKCMDTTSTERSCDAESFDTLEDEYENDFCAATSLSSVSNKLEDVAVVDSCQISKKMWNKGDILVCRKRMTIYYGTRTHKQISQVVKEFSRLPYGQDGIIHPPEIKIIADLHMEIESLITLYSSKKHTVLASREHMCINPAVRVTDDINSKCKECISSDGIGCSYKNSMRAKYERPNAIRRLIAQTTGKMNYIWDIEDLVEVLKSSTPSLCPYFSTARVLIDDADIIFVLSLILLSSEALIKIFADPIIRANSGLSLKNTIVILDEAHNVEDVCREAVSFAFMERELIDAAADLYQKAIELEKELAKVDAKIVAEEGLIEIEDSRTRRYKECLELLQDHFKTIVNFLNKILDWFVNVSSIALQSAPMKSDRLTYTYNWEKLFTTFENSDLNIFGKTGKGTAYSGLLEAFSSITGTGSDENDEFQSYLKHYKPCTAAVICVEKLLYFFKSYFRDDNRTAYKLLVCIDKPFVSYSQSDIFDIAKNSPNNLDILDMSSYDKEKEIWLDSKTPLKEYREVKYGYRVAINFWCMPRSKTLNPGTSPLKSRRPYSSHLAYIDAFKGCRSVILASGTLSPTDTFRTELGTPFQQEMEGNQIIPNEQIFAAGPSGEKLCGTYRVINRDDRFIREISLILSHICKIIPKGVLCFFSSYRVLDQIYEYMEMTGILRQIQNIKLVLKEPRRSSLMNTIMMQYENAIVNPWILDHNVLGSLCGNPLAYHFPMLWMSKCLRHRSDWGSILMLDERLLQTWRNPNAKKFHDGYVNSFGH
ncbi:BMA-DOG-1 [Dirofilaria immitis]|nr:BMA-DOG-1 [Dirofilaria immitis]